MSSSPMQGLASRFLSALVATKCDCRIPPDTGVRVGSRTGFKEAEGWVWSGGGEVWGSPSPPCGSGTGVQTLWCRKRQRKFSTAFRHFWVRIYYGLKKRPYS